NEQTGQWEKESTTCRRVSFWENQAEAVAEQVQKGDRVIVTGDEKLREYEWQDGYKGAAQEMRGRNIGKVVMPLQNKQPQQAASNASPGWTGQPQSQFGAMTGNAWAGGQQQGQGDAPPF